MSTEALERAIKIAGGQSALARKINDLVDEASRRTPIKQQNIWAWLNTTGLVPAEYAIPIERVTAGQVRRDELRPDIYPAEPADPSEGAAA